MTRLQLEHIIRAAAANADTREIVIVGSQAILGSFPDAPEELPRTQWIFPVPWACMHSKPNRLA